MDNNNTEMLSAAQETVKSQLIEGWWISGGLIYNKEFSDYREDIAVEQLPFSVRSSNGIRRAGLHMLSDLLIITVEELGAVKNMGAKSVNEIVLTVRDYLYGEQSIKPSTEIKITAPSANVKHEQSASKELPLSLLSLSNRSNNALMRCGYRYIHELADLSFDDFKQIKNLGAKSAKEIYEAVQRFSKEYEEKNSIEETPVSESANEPELNWEDIIRMIEAIRQECEQCGSEILLTECDHLLARAKKQDPMLIHFIHDSSAVFRIASVMVAIDKCITDGLSRHEIDGLSFVEIKEMFPESLSLELLHDRLNKLTESKTIKYTDRYYMYYPSFPDILSDSSDDRSAQVIIMRTQGMTLEEIARELGGLTRERVRQIEAKYLRKLFARYGHMDEDKYKYLYLTYDLSDELMERYLGFSKATVYFLENKYKGVGKKRPIDEKVPDDPKIPTLLKKQIEKYILSNKIQIGNDYVEAKLHLVEDALFPILCKETITFDDYIERLNDYVAAHHKPELIVSGNNLRTRSNKCAQSKLILWTLNQKMRYYDTEAIDKVEFLDKLNLNQYHDIEISAKKLLDENLDLMEEYDIRNEYELHNLLKKILEPSDCPGLVLGRSPIMQFSNADRGKQVVDLLAQLTPISQYDFADAYSELYGIPSATVMANYIPYVKQYINRDKILEMDVPALSDEEVNRLKGILTDDFYPIDRMRDIIHRGFPDMSQDKINHYTLRQLGFTVYSGYVIRSSYRNAQEYFTALLTSDDIIDTNLFPSEIFYIQSYYTVLTTLTDNYELIEFMPKKYIRLSRLTELFGTTKDDLIHFCEHVREFTDEQYFTVRSLRQEGFDDKLFELGFDDWFYSSVLASDKEHFAHRKYGGNMIFKVGTQSFLFSDFVEWLVYREESMSIDVYELVEMLSGIYGIRFDRYDIKWKILPGTSMYYNEITEKLYADYEIYFDEI